MNWDSLVGQLPIVAIFIWFVLEMDRRNANYAARRDAAWREFLEQQAKRTDEALDRMAALLDKVAKRLDEHDRFVRVRMAEEKRHER